MNVATTQQSHGTHAACWGCLSCTDHAVGSPKPYEAVMTVTESWSNRTGMRQRRQAHDQRCKRQAAAIPWGRMQAKPVPAAVPATAFKKPVLAVFQPWP